MRSQPDNGGRGGRAPAWQLLLASVPVAGSFALLAARLVPPTAYPDFLVGGTTFAASSSRWNFWIVPLLLVGFFASMAGLGAVAARVRDQSGEAAVRGYRTLLAAAAIPCVVWLGSLVLAPTTRPDLIHLSTILTLAVSLLAQEAVRRGFAPTAGALVRVAGGTILAPSLAALSGLAAAVAGCRVGTPTPAAMDRLAIWLPTVAFVAVAGAVAASWLATPTGRPRELERKLRLALVAGQLPLPAAFTVFLPTAFAAHGSLERLFPPDPVLYLLVLALAANAWIGLAGRARRPSASPLAAVTPMSVAAVVLLVRLPRLSYPFGLAGDDYHLGELILPWWSWRELDLVPFVDLSPSHGLLDVVYGLFSDLFFDGTAGSLAAAAHVLSGVFVVALVVGLSRVIGPLAAGVFGLLVPTTGSAYPAIAAVLCLLAQPRLLRRPIRWLALWLASGTVLVLLSPGHGLAFALATIPFGGRTAWRAVRQEPGAARRLLMSVAGVAAVVALTTDWGRILLGALRFALESSAVNEVSFASEWIPPSPREIPTSVGLWELARHGWALVALLGVLLLWRHRGAKSGTRRDRACLVGSTVILFILLLIPYTMGRNPPAGWARTGMMSAIACTVFLPMLAWTTLPRRRRDQALLPLVLLAAVVGAGGGAASRPSSWADRATTAPRLPANHVDGASVGLPRLGSRVMTADDLARIQTIRRHLDAWLRPGETYLDLTNRGAQYFYLGLRVPIESASYYNLVHRRQQLRSIQRLVADPPPVVLLSADNLSWGVPASLRSHLLYRHLMHHSYRTVARDGLTFLVAPDRLSGGVSDRSGILVTSGRTDVAWENGVSTEAPARIHLEPEPGRIELEPGDRLFFAHAGLRRVREVEGSVVTIDGDPLDPRLDGKPLPVRVRRSTGSKGDSELALLEAALAPSHLELLPVTWGRALELRRRARLVGALPGEAGGLDLIDGMEIRPGAYLLSGAGAQVRLSLGRPRPHGAQAGLLALDLECRPRSGEAVLEVFWKSAGRSGSRAQGSVRLRARHGPLLIPLDAHPGWLLARRLGRLRVEVVDPGSCREIVVSDLELLQRLDADVVDRLSGAPEP